MLDHYARGGGDEASLTPGSDILLVKKLAIICTKPLYYYFYTRKE